jgi:hypothetical protein
VCQGKFGPNALLVWRQGVRRPIEQRVSDDPFEGDQLDRFALPLGFRFRCSCPNEHETDYVGEFVDGVWTRTRPASRASPA